MFSYVAIFVFEGGCQKVCVMMAKMIEKSCYGIISELIFGVNPINLFLCSFLLKCYGPKTLTGCIT